jgi:hypothetical protein
MQDLRLEEVDEDAKDRGSILGIGIGIWKVLAFPP